MKRKREGLRNTALRVALLALGLLALPRNLCLAQTGLRSVSGRVTDASGAFVKGAVVELSDSRTMHVRSYVTQADGLYRFHGLHPLIDYRLRAQYQGRWSNAYAVGRYDSKIIARINVQIQLEDRHETPCKPTRPLRHLCPLESICGRASSGFSTSWNTRMEVSMSAEMTKWIDRWENEGGRGEATHVTGCSEPDDNGMLMPESNPSIGCASDYVESSDFA